MKKVDENDVKIFKFYVFINTKKSYHFTNKNTPWHDNGTLKTRMGSDIHQQHTRSRFTFFTKKI